jgi:biopolymer transport protein TolR
MPLIYLTFEIDQWFIPLEEKMVTRFAAPSGATRNFPFTKGVEGTRSAYKMAMSLGASPGRRAEMNVTPLIDVLLVLLIIFMVITPSLSIGLDARVPQPPNQKSSAPTDDIMIWVLGDGTVRLNEETVAITDLGKRLRDVFRIASDHVVFVRGDKKLDFEQVAEVIDIATGVGLDRIALVTQ